MSQNQYFRAGVGCVIFNSDNQILTFSRRDNDNIWQFPQGGMDPNESVEETLWRELFEETALTINDFAFTQPYNNWLYYEYPEKIRNNLRDKNCIGQTHRWFFLKAKDDIHIDLSKAQDKEFSGYSWTTFDELIKYPNDFKVSVYKKLKAFFEEGFKE